MEVKYSNTTKMLYGEFDIPNAAKFEYYITKTEIEAEGDKNVTYGIQIEKNYPSRQETEIKSVIDISLSKQEVETLMNRLFDGIPEALLDISRDYVQEISIA